MNDTEKLTAFTRGYTAEELYAKGYADGYENGRMSKDPVFFPPCIDCNKKMDEVRKAYDYWKAQKSDSDTISELEKVRQMILEQQGLTCDCNCNNCGWFPCADIDIAKIVKKDIKTIDKEISRLKGENNEKI